AAHPRLLHRVRQAAALGPAAGAHAQGARADRRLRRQGAALGRERPGGHPRRPGLHASVRLAASGGARRRQRRRPSLIPEVDLPRIERAVREILLAIGEDPERDGLRATPARVARAYAEQFAGLRQAPEDVLTTVFDAEYDEMVLVRDIEVYSTCE